ncbi:protein of unknown function [Burkholderia multivorans]
MSQIVIFKWRRESKGNSRCGGRKRRAHAVAAARLLHRTIRCWLRPPRRHAP